ncbi:hypothetical protein [Williamwhitmania taraxaci]|uniref:Uncharacterized protein n=1 Tax=Williamwhitmania taraxaci TaxID=1640674 RepID=A0A1G6T2U7_9BACT|nr:hypothetical protein [Williamwhitmania taraxaci]SDD23331.1 hypothetical protein SAMN05216323_11104 [Williamwhitmania taraxaci]
MNKMILFFVICFSISQFINAQTYYPNINSQSEKNLKIKKVERSSSSTIIEFEYFRTESKGIYIYLNPPNSDGAYYIQANGIKFLLLSTEGIANKDAITIAYPNKQITFSAIFEPLPKSITKFDLIEGATGTWNFYGIDNSNSDNSKTNPDKINFSSKTTDTLYYDSKWKGVDTRGTASFYRIINLDNNSNISGLVKDYYITGELQGKGDALFIDRYDDSNSKWKGIVYTYSKNGETLSETDMDKLCKSYYKDGKTFQYYVHNGISVTMHLSIERTYGKYYVAYVAIENLTGKSFNFNPETITAIMIKSGTETSGEVLSANEYMRKVNNRQAWNAALVAFGESSAANQAGYSSSTTTSSTSGYANSYGSASGYYGNTYGSVYGSSSTYGSATSRSNTQSYNGAANYAAQQNAQQNINNFQNQQYQIQNVLNQGYLKLNTIDNEQRIVGQININYKSADKIKVTIPVNGVNYDFWWNNN